MKEAKDVDMWVDKIALIQKVVIQMILIIVIGGILFGTLGFVSNLVAPVTNSVSVESAMENMKGDSSTVSSMTTQGASSGVVKVARWACGAGQVVVIILCLGALVTLGVKTYRKIEGDRE